MRRTAKYLLTIAALLGLALPASAVMTYHTSVASLEAAAGETSTVIDDYSDWSGGGSGDPLPSPAIRPGYTVTGNGYYLYGLAAFPGGALALGNGAHTFSFADPISAFGFDLFSNDFYYGNVLFFVGPDGLAAPTTPETVEFHGVVFDPPQTQVVVFLNAVHEYGWELDNLRTVPGPGQLASLAAGIAAFALLSVRRRPSR